MKTIFKLGVFLSFSLLSTLSFAGMDGAYKSEANCKLQVSVSDDDSGYADAKYNLRSDGTGSCEWTGVGVGKRFKIEAGIVSQSSAAFAEMNWVYGPEGDKVEVTFYDTDGTLRHKETYERVYTDSVAKNQR